MPAPFQRRHCCSISCSDPLACAPRDCRRAHSIATAGLCSKGNADARRYGLASAFPLEVPAVHGDELSTAANTKNQGRLNMTMRHINSNSNSQSPASESCTAAGFHIIGRYRNADGSLGLEIRINAGCTDGGKLSYTGSWGMGTPENREAMRIILRAMLHDHGDAVADIPFGNIEACA
jgi:hypothetical protein